MINKRRLAVASGAVCWVAAWCSGGARAATAQYFAEYQVSAFARAQNAQADNGVLRLARLPTAGADQVIVLAAALADHLALEDQGRRLGFDPAANCRYIDYVARAEYRFAAPTAGKRQVWYRTFFPIKAHWVHEEHLDNGPVSAVVDSAADRAAGQWLWVKGPAYEITAGLHTLVLDGYHGGARLDKILLAPENYVPAGPGPAAACREPPARGRLTTASILPPGLRAWRDVTWTAVPGGGQATLLVSADAGQTWKPVPPTGDLQEFNRAGHASPALQLALELAAGADGTTPLIQDLAFHYLGPSPVVLFNNRLELRFSAVNGGLIGLRDLPTGRAYIADDRTGSGAPICALLTRKDHRPTEQTAPELVKQEVSTSQRGPKLVQTYRFPKCNVTAMVTVRLASPNAWFEIAVTNAGPEEVLEVEFPKFGGLRAGERGNDDYLLIPNLMDNLWKNPSQSPLLWKQTATYDRATPMKFFDLWDEAGGLYVASHDPTFRDEGIVVRQGNASAIAVLFRKYVWVPPGRAWQSAPTKLALHQGDWHAAADDYTRWARRQVKPPDNPRWVREEFDGFMASFGSGHANYGFSESLEALQYARATHGLTDLLSHRQGFDTGFGFCGLYPSPNPMFGGPAELTQVDDLVKQFGGHQIWYVCWDLWCPTYGVTPRIGGTAANLLPPDTWRPSLEWSDQNAARDALGNYTRPTTNDVYCETTLCNAAVPVQDWHVYWAKKYLGEYHADGVYWDTLLDSYGICLDPVHAGDLGQWSRGSTRALQRIVAATRALNPHAFHAGEVFGDPSLAQYETIHMGGARRWLRYLFPETVYVAGSYDALPPAAAAADLEQTFLTGTRFLNVDLHGANGTFPPGYPADYGLEVLALQRQLKQLVYRATYRDTVGLEVHRANGQPTPANPEAIDSRSLERPAGGWVLAPPPAAGPFARRFRLEQASTKVEIVNTANPTGSQGATLRLRDCPLRPVRKLWLFSFGVDGQPWPLAITNSLLEIPFPTNRLASLVLVQKCEPLLDVVAPTYATGGTTVPVNVTVRNLNAAPLAGQLSLSRPPGFAAAPVAFGPLRPGEKKSYRLEVHVGPGVPLGRYDLEVAARGGGVAGRRLFWIYVGHPLRASIQENLDRLGLDVTLENFAAKPISGYCRLAEDGQFRGDPVTAANRFPFTIAAGTGIVVTVGLELKRPLALPHLARVKVVYDGYEQELVKSVRPAIPNGDFEVDLAGDGHPDFWTCRTGYDRYTLDAVEKFSGRYSVRLSPPRANQTANYLDSQSTALRPGKQYRIKLAIKREKDPAKVYALFTADGRQLQLGQTGTCGKWEVFTTTFTAPPRPDPAAGSYYGPLGYLGCLLFNCSSGNAWFDAVSIEEVR